MCAIYIEGLSAGPAPIIQPSALPELKLTDYPDCQAEAECKTCGSSGQVEVCSVCLEQPEIVCGVEACACTFPSSYSSNTLAACEFCGTLHPGSTLILGSCTTCFDEAHERYKAEMGEDSLEF